MNCHKIQGLLDDYLKGRLPEPIKAEVEAHLKLCLNCQKEKELSARLSQLLDTPVTPQLKEDFTPALMRKIHSEEVEIVKVTYRLPRFALRPLAPAFASLFIILLAVSLFWNKIGPKDKLTKGGPRVTVVGETEIIENLDILRDIELLENMDLISELDILENLEETISGNVL